LMNGDPYDALGFGMHAYRNTLFILAITFLVISIITCGPQSFSLL